MKAIVQDEYGSPTAIPLRSLALAWPSGFHDGG
jgi:hypothetical protein